MNPLLTSPDSTPQALFVDAPTVIIGAGPAGLAVAACLKKRGLPSIILERSGQVGASWRAHYERLHLHTSKAFSELPFFRFPGSYPRYPSRLQVVEYLEAYARAFALDIRFNQTVHAARQAPGGWELETQDSRYRVRNLVIATGYCREPILPDWPGKGSYRGLVLHSSEYRNGEPFRGQRVLVVGFGNSGGEIAIDLWEHGARPGLAVRGPVNVIPRELLGIPILAISLLQSALPPALADAINAPILNAVFGDLGRLGLRKAPYGPQVQIQQSGRIPLIDVGTIDLIKRGEISVHPGIESFTENGVVFSGGDEENFDAVILATGFRPRVNAFLEGGPGLYDENGTPRFSGQESQLSGLYFCGYYVAPTGMLREIALEAQRISKSIFSRG